MLLLRCNNRISTAGLFLDWRKIIFEWFNWIYLTTIISLRWFIACNIGRLSKFKAAFGCKIEWVRIVFIRTFLFFFLSFVQGAKTLHDLGCHRVLMKHSVKSMISIVYKWGIERLIVWNWEWLWLIISMRNQALIGSFNLFFFWSYWIFVFYWSRNIRYTLFAGWTLPICWRMICIWILSFLLFQSEYNFIGV